MQYVRYDEKDYQNDANISSFLWGADGLINNRDFLKDWSR